MIFAHLVMCLLVSGCGFKLIWSLRWSLMSFLLCILCFCEKIDFEHDFSFLCFLLSVLVKSVTENYVASYVYWKELLISKQWSLAVNIYIEEFMSKAKRIDFYCKCKSLMVTLLLKIERSHRNINRRKASLDLEYGMGCN